jgi:hypothetical protein
MTELRGSVRNGSKADARPTSSTGGKRTFAACNAVTVDLWFDRQPGLFGDEARNGNIREDNVWLVDVREARSVRLGFAKLLRKHLGLDRRPQPLDMALECTAHCGKVVQRHTKLIRYVLHMQVRSSRLRRAIL